MSTALPPWLPPLVAGAARVSPALAARLAAELLTRPRGRNPAQPWELAAEVAPTGTVVMQGGLVCSVWGEAGPAVLAMHGWRGRPGQFGPLARRLVARGLRLIAVDAPGHGRSPGSRATPHLLADALLAAATLGPVCGLVGHSLGGAAAGIALERGLPHARLALIASPTRVSRMIDGYADELRLAGEARRLFDTWFVEHAGRPPAELDLVAVLARLQGAVLVIHDEADDTIPVEEARLLLRHCARAQSLFTRGLGHRDLLVAPPVIDALADFLAGERGTGG